MKRDAGMKVGHVLVCVRVCVCVLFFMRIANA